MGFSVEDPASMEVWYPLGSRILHVGHFLQDLLAPLSPGTGGSLGLATAPGAANAVLVIRTPPESGHTIYDTFDDEKRVI
jgi:hypothetical protein